MAGFVMSSTAPQVVHFINQTTINISHALGYKPMVYIVDSSGHLITADITHNSNTSITILFVIAVSGSVFLR